MPGKARILAEMKRFSAPYTCTVFACRPDDTADPPGPRQGSGSFVRMAGNNLALTCDHVEREATTGGQPVAGVGESQGLRLDSAFSPIDAAAAIEAGDWARDFPNALAVLPRHRLPPDICPDTRKRGDEGRPAVTAGRRLTYCLR